MIEVMCLLLTRGIGVTQSLQILQVPICGVYLAPIPVCIDLCFGFRFWGKQKSWSRAYLAWLQCVFVYVRPATHVGHRYE
jgi:hypothetical protein